MNIFGWYRTLSTPLTSEPSSGSATVVMDPTRLPLPDPMVVHLAAGRTQTLLPWHVLTQLTAIHLHDSQTLGLGGQEFVELGGLRNHLDPAHFLGGIAPPHHINPAHQQKALM